MVWQCEKPKVCHRRRGGTSAYTQLAQDMGERQRAAKEAAHALLTKLPCERRKDERKGNADVEPEWFKSAMKKVWPASLCARGVILSEGNTVFTDFFFPLAFFPFPPLFFPAYRDSRC